MKKSILTVALAFILCFTTLQVRAAAAEDELTRAMGLGIVSELPGDAPISASTFFAMLDRVVERTDGDALSGFQSLYPGARSSDGQMTRYDGMVAVLAAAECLDSATLNVDDWFELHEQMGMETCWDTIRWTLSCSARPGAAVWTAWSGTGRRLPISTPSAAAPVTVARPSLITTRRATPCAPTSLLRMRRRLWPPSGSTIPWSAISL